MGIYLWGTGCGAWERIEVGLDTERVAAFQWKKHIIPEIIDAHGKVLPDGTYGIPPLRPHGIPPLRPSDTCISRGNMVS